MTIFLYAGLTFLILCGVSAGVIVGLWWRVTRAKTTITTASVAGFEEGDVVMIGNQRFTVKKVGSPTQFTVRKGLLDWIRKR